jgi:hypothetical protein
MEQNCPKCNSVLDEHVCTNDKTAPDIKPKEGDITICFYCQTPLIIRFGKLKVMTDEEKDLLKKEEPEFYQHLIKTIWKIKEMT